MSERLDRELSLRGIVGFAVGLVLMLLLAAAALWFLTGWLASRSIAADPPPPALREARQPWEPPGPPLQTDPFRDLDELRAAEEEILRGWAWVDESAGLARIPVEKAMDLYAAGERAGVPVQPAAPAPEAPTETETPADEGGEGGP
jgi:hypothetical protein